MKLDKMCQRVNAIIMITQYGGIIVKCPTCGKWGRPNRKRHHAFFMAHGHGERCSITHDVKFYHFIEDIMHTVHNMNSVIRRNYIQKGRLPINIPNIQTNIAIK